MQTHVSTDELHKRLESLGQSPKDSGLLQMIVCRPARGERRIVEVAELDVADGLVGDNWKARGSDRTEDGSAHPEMQITVMNSRVVDAVAQERDRWALAGDQLYIDLDLSIENLPTGQRIALGTAILEVTDVPHTGCQKFTERFGHDAIRMVNSPEGRQQRRRGMYVKVIQPGVIRVGDKAIKVATH